MQWSDQRSIASASQTLTLTQRNPPMNYDTTTPPRPPRPGRHAAQGSYQAFPDPLSLPDPRPVRPAVAQALLAGLAIGSIIAGGIGYNVGKLAGGPSASTVVTLSTPTPSPTASTPAPSPTPSVSSTKRPPRTLTEKDFEITLKETNRQCYPPVGCNVTYRPVLTIMRADLLKSGVVYEITYKVRGGDAPESGRILLEDGKYNREETTTGVPRESSVLTAITSDVEALG